MPSKTGHESRQRLTPKAKRFCHEYRKDLNATQAAIRAGYSAKYANDIAYRLRQNPRVKAELAAAALAYFAESDATIDRTLREIECVAFANPKELCAALGIPVAVLLGRSRIGSELLGG